MWLPAPRSPATISLPGSGVSVRALDGGENTWKPLEGFFKGNMSSPNPYIPRISNTPLGVWRRGSLYILKNLTMSLLLSLDIKDNQAFTCFLDLSITLQLWSTQPGPEEATLLVLGALLLLTQPEIELGSLTVLLQN